MITVQLQHTRFQPLVVVQYTPTLMVIQPTTNTLLPPVNALRNIGPIPQANRLLRRSLHIAALKAPLKDIHAGRDPRIILLPNPLQTLLVLDLFHRLPRFHNLHQQRIIRYLRALVFDVDPALRQQVARSPQRVLQRLVRLVDARAESLGLPLLVGARAVGVGQHLQLDELFA